MFRDTITKIAQRSHNNIGDESRNPPTQSDEEEVAVTQALDQAIEVGGNKKMAALNGHISCVYMHGLIESIVLNESDSICIHGLLSKTIHVQSAYTWPQLKRIISYF